jgi:hypothetical protein
MFVVCLKVLYLRIINLFNPMKTTKTRRKDLAYTQTKVSQALNPMEKPEALLDWSIEQLLKLVKK